MNIIKNLHWFSAECDEKAMQKVLIGKEIEQRCSEHSKHLADKINLMEAKYELEIANKIDRKEFENRMSKAMSKNNDNMACSR